MRRCRLSCVWTALSVVLALSLTGCGNDLTNMTASAFSPGLSASARSGPSPKAASVALASFDGLPGSLAQRFQTQLQAQAPSRDIKITDATTAAYLVRGYLTVRSDEDGVSVGYVWDLFDRAHRRAQRMEDNVALGKATANTTPDAQHDVWAQVDDKVLQTIAARSMDDLAAFLSTTPEATQSAALATPQRADSPEAAPGATVLTAAAPNGNAPSSAMPTTGLGFAGH